MCRSNGVIWLTSLSPSIFSSTDSDKMRLLRLSLIVSIPILLSITVWASEDRINKSTPGLIWSTGKEVGELYRKSHSEEPVALNEHDELDGGFSSLDGMLQWAIGNFLFVLSSVELFKHMISYAL